MSDFDERARRAGAAVWDKTAAVTPRMDQPVARRPKIVLAAAAAVLVAAVIGVATITSSDDDDPVALAELAVGPPEGFREVSQAESSGPPQGLDPATTATMKNNGLVKAFSQLSERPQGVALVMALQFPDDESAAKFVADYADFFEVALPSVSGSRLAVDDIADAHGFQGVIVLASPQNPTPIAGGSGIFFARGPIVFSLGISTTERTDTADLVLQLARQQAERADG